jgi:hypothetical protein
LIAGDLLFECEDRGIEGRQAPFGRIPAKGQESELVLLILAPGLGAIHGRIARRKGGKHPLEP